MALRSGLPMSSAIGTILSAVLTTPLKMAKIFKQKYFCERNYKLIKNPDGTTCLNGWIKIKIPLAFVQQYVKNAV